MIYLKKLARLYNINVNRITRNYYYTMPEKYFNSFYHANSQLYECVNYYLHTAYEIVCNDLIEEMRKRKNYKQLANENIIRRSILNIIDSIDNCNDLIDVHLPIKLNNGTYKVIRGFRAHHGLYHLQRPCLGGFRMCSDVSRDHVKALAVLNTYKNACIGVNMAGAHGALQIVKNEFDDEEIERILRAYGYEMTKKFIYGDVIDIYEPDMYCNVKEVSWLEDTNRTHNNAKYLHVVKDANYLDTLGICPFLILKYLTNDETLMTNVGLKEGLKDKTFICDGLGKIGVSLARYLEESGARCIGFKETDCFMYDTNGFSIKDLIDYKNKFGSFKGFNDGITESDSKSIVLTKECDILLLCSSHKTLNCYIAENVQAKIVFECASLAITPIAHRILIDCNRLVVPDILSTSGISLMNYLNYMDRYRPSRKLNVMERNLTESIDRILSRKVDRRTTNEQLTFKSQFMKENTLFVTENILKEVVDNVMDVMDSYNLKLDLRTATYICSIKKLFNCIFDTNKY